MSIRGTLLRVLREKLRGRPKPVATEIAASSLHAGQPARDEAASGGRDARTDMSLPRYDAADHDSAAIPVSFQRYSPFPHARRAGAGERDSRMNSTARCAWRTGHTFQSGAVITAAFAGGEATVRFIREGVMQSVICDGADWHADAAHRMGFVQELTAPGKQLDRLPTWQGRLLRLLRSAWAPPLSAARSAKARRWRW